MNTVSQVQSGSTWVGETTLVGMNCPECGIVYAIPLRYRDQARAEGHGKKQWFCPMGHKLGFHGESEIERERRKFERERNRADSLKGQREEVERRLSAQKGATTRARKRHAAGVCPVCTRSFKQVREHMERMHPDYNPRSAI